MDKQLKTKLRKTVNEMYFKKSLPKNRLRNN